MATGTSTYENGLTSGTAASAGNSTSDGGPAWTPTTANSGTLTYDSTATHRGSLALLAQATGATNRVARKDITGLTATDAIYRPYLYCDALPGTAESRIVEFVTSGSNVRVGLTTAGLVRVYNAAGTLMATSTTAVTAGTWWGLRFRVVPVSGSLGTITLELFTGSDLETNTPTETVFNGSGNQNTGTTSSVTAIRVGKIDSASQLNLRIDDDQYATAGETLGPLAPATTTPITASDSTTLTDSSVVVQQYTSTDAATVDDQVTSVLINDGAAVEGTLSESVALTTTTSGGDSTTLTESTTVVTYISTTDTGTLTEAAAVTSAATASDTGSLTDASQVTVGGVTATATDAGALTDASAVTGSFSANDTAALTEAVTITVTLAALDGLAHTEQATALAAALTATDPATQADLSALLQQVTAVDVSTLGDVSSLLIITTTIGVMTPADAPTATMRPAPVALPRMSG